MGQVYRLKGPADPSPQVSTEETKNQGGGCKGVRTLDLVLTFPSEPKKWLDSKTLPTGPCAIMARPLGEGRFEIRISYPATGPKNVRLAYLPFISTQKYVIDHWLQVPAPKSAKPKSEKKNSVAIKSVDTEMPSAKVDATSLASNFESQSSWERILGSAAMALDFNSPELDRFRDKEVEKNLGLSNEAIELRDLKLPELDLPPMESPLTFAEEKPHISPFDLSREGVEGGKALRDVKAVEDGMNLVRVLADKGEWLKARESIDILERSRQRARIPLDDAKWATLKGLIYMRLGHEMKEKILVNKAIEIWRDGLRKSNGWGGETQEYMEFMALETVRNLFDQNLIYAAASVLSWSRRYSWSSAAEERFDYLRGEAFYRLGLYDAARDAFTEFLFARKDIPINSFADRRLVSASAYRLGDLELKSGEMKKAIDAYTRAFEEGPRVRKFSFEGNWLPEDVRIFPYTLFNRAEAEVRIGREDSALRDLRAFLFVSPSHPDSGLVYYRIGDVLGSLGAPTEKVMGAWRECVFKVPKTLGGRLCLARKAAEEMAGSPQDKWPRLIADIEDGIESEKKDTQNLVNPDELTVYLNLLLAHAFLKVDRPYQALLRLDPLQTLSISPYLAAWYHEYLVTAVVGYADKQVQAGKFQEVIKDYEKRQKTLFLGQTRSEALWSVARAYRGLRLYDEALATLTSGEKVRDRLVRKKIRPYEPHAEDWIALRAAIQTDMLAADDKRIDPKWIREGLGKLDASLPEVQKLWIHFSRASGSVEEEAEWYGKLENSSGFGWADLERYVDVLAELKQTDRQRELVERRVGSWFSEKDKMKPGLPPASLVMKLFDARAETGAVDGAVAVADFLTTLSAEQLGSTVTKPMVIYKKGQLLRKAGRKDEARQSFERAKQLAPESVWGKLSASAQKEMKSEDL